MSRNLLKEIVSADDAFIQNTLDSMDAKKFKDFCEIAIKQQDRDTRHACAESFKAKHLGTLAASIGHNQCMNCRGGVEL